MDKSRKIYSDQGQFKYPEIDCSRPLTIQRSKIGMVYFYIGQMQEGTNMRDGVGIAVHDSGDIEEGYWKKDSLNGFWRTISSIGSYYIGEFKNFSHHGHGTYCANEGNKFIGEYKNGRRIKEAEDAVDETVVDSD